MRFSGTYCLHSLFFPFPFLDPEPKCKDLRKERQRKVRGRGRAKEPANWPCWKHHVAAANQSGECDRLHGIRTKKQPPTFVIFQEMHRPRFLGWSKIAAIALTLWIPHEEGPTWCSVLPDQGTDLSAHAHELKPQRPGDGAMAETGRLLQPTVPTWPTWPRSFHQGTRWSGHRRSPSQRIFLNVGRGPLMATVEIIKTKKACLFHPHPKIIVHPSPTYFDGSIFPSFSGPCSVAHGFDLPKTSSAIEHFFCSSRPRLSMGNIKRIQTG